MELADMNENRGKTKDTKTVHQNGVWKKWALTGALVSGLAAGITSCGSVEVDNHIPIPGQTTTQTDASAVVDAGQDSDATKPDGSVVNQVDAGQDVDGGVAKDGGAEADAGQVTDAGQDTNDSGALQDGGQEADASTGTDSGALDGSVEADAGQTSDASVDQDAGVVIDAGVVDGSTATDGGSVDAGHLCQNALSTGKFSDYINNGASTTVGGFTVTYQGPDVVDGGDVLNNVVMNVACGNVQVGTVVSSLDLVSTVVDTQDGMAVNIDVTQIGAFSIYAGITVTKQ